MIKDLQEAVIIECNRLRGSFDCETEASASFSSASESPDHQASFATLADLSHWVDTVSETGQRSAPVCRIREALNVLELDGSRNARLRLHKPLKPWGIQQNVRSAWLTMRSAKRWCARLLGSVLVFGDVGSGSLFAVTSSEPRVAVFCPAARAHIFGQVQCLTSALCSEEALQRVPIDKPTLKLFAPLRGYPDSSADELVRMPTTWSSWVEWVWLLVLPVGTVYAPFLSTVRSGFMWSTCQPSHVLYRIQ